MSAAFVFLFLLKLRFSRFLYTSRFWLSPAHFEYYIMKFEVLCYLNFLFYQDFSDTTVEEESCPIAASREWKSQFITLPLDTP